MTAVTGQNSIVLSESVDWIVGDEIIITTTDTNIEHTERHTIANISIDKTRIGIVNPLVYTHIVIHNVFPSGQIFHLAGVVGLLKRNIRIINRSPSSELFGFRIVVTDYAINIWNPVAIDAPNEDKREGIHIYNLGNWNPSRATFINSCSFDGGYYSAIGIWQANSIPITNNIVYKTYESAIVLNRNWQFNANDHEAIMSTDAISVIMRNNLVAGVERLAYRIQGNSCPGAVLPSDINNDYVNNEVHSAMSGINCWPMDKDFDYDTTWYYGLYINAACNIIIDSCTAADINVGIYTFIIGPLDEDFWNRFNFYIFSFLLAVSHVAGDNSNYDVHCAHKITGGYLFWIKLQILRTSSEDLCCNI
ncbi:unnamed protein product [Rotaria magnacalcarata]|uniref:Right handed beta helix domain-containing protein n=2 Tax=Rotaria magnacalcarata TaxID=392030 RepID=A0A819X181_9BILA|nr:unnamed protein product [Rotaria magnacalcarata]